MKVLDFGSGGPKDAINNWQSQTWLRNLQALVTGRVEEIHCLDTLKIKTPFSHNQLHFHKFSNTLPNTFDLICAIHPNPATVLELGHTGREDDFQNGRYISFLAAMLAKKLAQNGKVIIQFDDELKEKLSDTGEEVFFRMLDEMFQFETRKQPMCLKSIGNAEISLEPFPSADYTFSSLHVFQKIAA